MGTVTMQVCDVCGKKRRIDTADSVWLHCDGDTGEGLYRFHWDILICSLRCLIEWMSEVVYTYQMDEWRLAEQEPHVVRYEWPMEKWFTVEPPEDRL